MKIRIITVSPQWQFTIPTELRTHLISKKYILEIRGEILILKPCKMMMKMKDSFINKVILDKILKLSGDEKEIFNLVSKKSCSSNAIAATLDMEISRVNIALTLLELHYLVKNEFGRWKAIFD